jgi:hypothetical protein
LFRTGRRDAHRHRHQHERRDGCSDRLGGETELLLFQVNEIAGSMYGATKPDGWGDTEVDAFVEPATAASVAGLPRIGDVFVVRKNQKPLWVPFSAADALKPTATTGRAAFEQMRDGYNKEVASFTNGSRRPSARPGASGYSERQGMSRVSVITRWWISRMLC